MKRQIHHLHAQAGFTLVELSILLAVLSIIAGTIFMEMVAGSASFAQKETLRRMQVVEDALAAHFLGNGYLPCPARTNTAVTDANYGRAVVPVISSFTPLSGSAFPVGDCTVASAVKQVNASASGAVAFGAVPTKTLALPDEYALDGWGRRMRYNVAVVHTLPSGQIINLNPEARLAVWDNEVPGAITDATRVDAMLISYGENGHGAWPASGAVFTSMIQSLSIDSFTCSGAMTPEEVNSCSASAFFARYNFDPKGKSGTRFDQIIYPIDLSR